MYGKKNMQWIILKQAANKQELTNWKNILITKNKNCIINFEILPADHLTKQFILNPVEGSRSKNFKPESVTHGLTVRTRSLKALPIY